MKRLGILLAVLVLLGAVAVPARGAQLQVAGKSALLMDIATGTVIYENKDASLDVKYNEYFKVNGAVVDTDYARYENAYVPNGKIERGAKVMTFEFEGYSLTLDFEAGTREE